MRRTRLGHTRLTAAFLLALYLAACASYSTLADPAAGLQAAPAQIKEVRVTLKSGKHLALKDPKVDGDSLRGVTAGRKTRSLALDDITKVEVKKSNTVATVALVLGVTVIAGAVIGAIAAAGSYGDSCSISGEDYSW